jgi:ubiquinone/menaquinone biosynthesis C-methylase UbiE
MKENKKKHTAYLHGFSEAEQNRLKKQAEFMEHHIYKNVDLTDVTHLLEVGCGVGAQSSILLRRFPKLNLTGIDLSEKQLAAAESTLDSLLYAEDRYKIKKMDAQKMSFKDNSFDGAFLCWVLEHVPDPLKIVNEVRRVLRPNGVVYITEVINSSFFLNPYSPNLWKYWMAFNDFQYDHAGDPFIGAKLGNFLTAAGFQNIETNVVTFHLDNRLPEKRKQMIEYWIELLMSGAEQLIKAGYTTKEIAKAGMQEMRAASKDPNAVFMYSFMQAKAKAP